MGQKSLEVGDEELIEEWERMHELLTMLFQPPRVGVSTSIE